MPAEAKFSGFEQTNSTDRCWKLLECLHKPKRSIAIDGFVPIFGPKSSLLNIHDLTAADRYNLDSFPSSLDLERSSISLRIKRLGAEWFLVAALAIFLSSFCKTRCLYTVYGDMITCDQVLMRFTIM